MLNAVQHMAWWGWILTVLAAYVYGVITVAKYTVKSAVLDARKLDDGYVPSVSFLWPIVLIVGDHEAKGLLYPTLWMWPRYRKEWPLIKAEERRQVELKNTIAVKQRSREFERENLTLTIADVQEDIKQEKTLDGLRAQLDELNKLHAEGPVPIDAPERDRKKPSELMEEPKLVEDYDRDKGQWRTFDDSTEWWCMTHRHYTTEWRAHKEGCK